MSIESVTSSNHLILCCLLLLLPSIFPSIRVFSNESALRIRWPKYWSFSFNISPSNEHPGLISFRIDWLDLLAVQGTTDWFQIGKGVHQGCILSPCLFNLYAEYITSWEIDGETVETVSDFIFWGSKITADGDCSHEIKRCLLFGGKL